jgi:hypothetical protein
VTVASRAVWAVAVVAVLSCSDSEPGIEPTSPTPTQPLPALGGVRGTADLVAGTLTFEPLTRPSGFHRSGSDVRPAAIYGDQGVTVRIYNSPVTITNPSSPGKKTFSAPVGVRNLLSFPIGDEQGGSAPLDTMGIYVFVNSGPTVTSTSSPCSPACTVTVQNHHGTLAFNNPSQRYWHWPERVGAAGGGSDTTLARKTWVFEADTQVTGFQFDVLVSAAWPPPNDSRWKIDYQGDSLPDTQEEPRWRLTNVGGTYAATDGVLNITTAPPTDAEFYRRDSVTTAANAYAEARVRFNSTSGGRRAAIHFNDGVKYVALGIGPGEVGFISSAQNAPFIVSWAATTNTFRTYQLRKYAADSAVIYVDGARVGAIAYADLSADPTAASDTRVSFGCPRTGASSNADWDYVLYEIGAVEP